MEQYDLAVIGGGAAGLAAATAASSLGDRVVVLERSSAVAHKILVSGNGRCNLMNSGEPRYYANPIFIREVLRRCGAEQQRRFWHTLGLILSEPDEEKRVYPCTYQSASVSDALKSALKRNRVEIRLNTHVTSCDKEVDGIFRITSDGKRTAAKRVLVATGSPAGLKTSGADMGYDILKSFGHVIHEIQPALVPLNAERKSISGLAGIRSKCRVTLLDAKDQILHRAHGEVLFTESGISGICVMQCARFIQDGCIIELDLAERMFRNDDEFREELAYRRARFGEETPSAMLAGILPLRLSYAVMKQAGVPMKGERIRDLDKETTDRVIHSARHYRIGITGIRSMEDAQVCAGGADCRMFDTRNMESRLVPGLFAAGEVLDADGDCGGFNLMFAFGSGILAGVNRRPAEYVNDTEGEEPV